MLQTSQTFLKSSSSDFVETVNKALLFAEISLYKLNNKHVKNIFSDFGHGLPCKTTCGKAMPKLGADELQRLRNAVNDKLVFLVFDENTLFGTQYLNILILFNIRQ